MVLRPVERGTRVHGVTNEQEGGAFDEDHERTAAAPPDLGIPAHTYPSQLSLRMRGVKMWAGGGCHPDDNSLAITGR